MIGYHLVGYHVIGYHIIGYHNIGYHIIGYHIIGYLTFLKTRDMFLTGAVDNRIREEKKFAAMCYP